MKIENQLDENRFILKFEEGDDKRNNPKPIIICHDYILFSGIDIINSEIHDMKGPHSFGCNNISINCDVLPQIIILLYSLLSLIVVGILIYLIVKFFQCWGETIGDWIKKFIFMFKPLLNISLVFVWIWTGIKLFCGMVYSIYKQQCPLITWED